MKQIDFIKMLELAESVPNFYCNTPGKNLGYHWSGGQFSFDCWNMIKVIIAGWNGTNPVGTNYMKIATMNGIINPNRIFVGQKLRVR